MRYPHPAASHRIRYHLSYGERLEYDAIPPIYEFLTRFERLARTPDFKYGDLAQFLKSGANPLMEPIAGRAGYCELMPGTDRHPAWLQLQDLLACRKAGELDPLPEDMRPSYPFRSPLLSRWGTKGDFHMKVRIPLPLATVPLELATPPGGPAFHQVEPGIWEVEAPPGWKTVKILTVRKTDGSSRMFILRHQPDGEFLDRKRFEWGGLFVEGHFDIIWWDNNAKRAREVFGRYLSERY